MIGAAIAAILALGEPVNGCPDLIRTDLEERRRHCLHLLRPFDDPDFLQAMTECDQRVRKSARTWSCPVPAEWGEPWKLWRSVAKRNEDEEAGKER